MLKGGPDGSAPTSTTCASTKYASCVMNLETLTFNGGILSPPPLRFAWTLWSSRSSMIFRDVARWQKVICHLRFGAFKNSILHRGSTFMYWYYFHNKRRYFSEQHLPIDVCSRHGLCSLCPTDFLYQGITSTNFILQTVITLQHGVWWVSAWTSPVHNAKIWSSLLVVFINVVRSATGRNTYQISPIIRQISGLLRNVRTL